MSLIPKEKEYKLVKKCLSTDDITLAKFLYELRSHPQLKEIFDPTQTYYLITESNVIPPVSMTMGIIREKWKCSEDDILYLYLAKENVFG